MIPAVPGVERLARDIVQHPALARLHAGLMDAGAEQVVVVAHHDAILGIDHLALIAFDVELDAGRVLFLYRFDRAVRFLTLELVMSNCKEGAS
jgi:hypothetical protein